MDRNGRLELFGVSRRQSSHREGPSGINQRPSRVSCGFDYHTIWMNKEALKAFGITKGTKSVKFAEDVLHDKKTGEPTGIVVGFGSTGLSTEAEQQLSKILPSHSHEGAPARTEQLLRQAARARGSRR